MCYEKNKSSKKRRKIDRTFTRINGVENYPSEKEKHFAEQQQHIEQSKQQLGMEFQNLANRILEEKSQSFNQTNQTALETLLKPFREQIEAFKNESMKSIRNR